MDTKKSELRITEDLINEQIGLGVAEYFREWIRLLTWSGRYEYSGVKKSIAKEVLTGRQMFTTARLIRNPEYRLEEPILRRELTLAKWHKSVLHIRLHIDIDGTDPLQVVSGRITSPWPLFLFPKHFVGEVTANSPTASGRTLVVENFDLEWPTSNKQIDRLNITLSDIVSPSASAVFVATDGTEYGPYSMPRKSRYFREVEFEVDREEDAQQVEPYHTHTHPVRPADLPGRRMTIASAYAKAGINVSRSDEENVIATPGADSPGGASWTTEELHDAMEDQWSAFANQPQWKLWFFIAELHEDDGLAGIMFDSTTPEADDVTRQGAAIFTQLPIAFHTDGEFPQQNLPAAEAVERELFMISVHEIGHAFNLLHSWRKTAYNEWPRPVWADQPVNDSQAPSWMNYSFRADTDPVDALAADDFYDDFYFRFIDEENFFLRHAPDRYVQMGNETWLSNHGYAFEDQIDPRLSLAIRTRRQALEMGEAVFMELRLRNMSREVVKVVDRLNPAAGNVEIAITDPDGNRLPFLPPVHVDYRSVPRDLAPGASIHESVQLTVGKIGGFHFKKPGAYRIEAAYTNIDGKQAAAVAQVWVKPCPSHDCLRAVSDLYTGRTARVLYFGGSRVMEDVNDRLAFVSKRLEPEHPAQIHIASCLSLPLSKRWKRIDRDANERIELPEEPAKVIRILAPAMKKLELAADTLGHIRLRRVADTYIRSAVRSRKHADAKRVMRQLVTLFEKRGVSDPVLKEMNAELKRMK